MVEGPFPEHHEPFGRLRRRAASEGAQQSPRGSMPMTAPTSAPPPIPLCRNDLSPYRAIPPLDEARAHQCDPPAGAIRRDRRGSGEEEGHRAGRLGARLVQARRDDLQGLCHATDQADDRRREADACRGRPVGLGLHGPGAARLWREHAHAFGRRRRYADAGVQGVLVTLDKVAAPVARELSHVRSAVAELHRISATTITPPSAAGTSRRSPSSSTSRAASAARHARPLHGMDRPARRSRAFQGNL